MKKTKRKMASRRPAAPAPTPGTVTRPPLARMLRIHERLQEAAARGAGGSGRPVNCTSLARELEVNPKTVQRDVDFMRDRLGLPVEYDPATRGLVYAGPVTQFPTVQITEGELVALSVARQALGQYRGTPFEKPLRAAFAKITAGLRDQVRFAWFGEGEEENGGGGGDAAISFRSSSAGRGVVADVEAFETASRAVFGGEEVVFDYQKLGAAAPERRRVRPLHLGCIDGAWYLFGQDLGRPGEPLRTFALSRLRGLRGTGEFFEKPAGGFSLERHLANSFGVFAPGGAPTEVRLRFDAFAGRLVTERVWHPSQRLEPRGDGGTDLLLTVHLAPEVERWVLSWGDHVEVLAPGELRATVARVAAEVARRHA